MAPKTILHALLSAVCLAHVAHAVGKASQYPQGSQYIRFSGTVSAKVTWEKDIVPTGVDYASCYHDYSSGPHPRSHLYVGVNPPWDTNPFFFELHHLVSDDCDSYFCNTRDTIMNLYFGSASYECFNGNKLCSWLVRGDRYVPKVYLDLKPGKGAQMTPTQVGGQAGYSVKGGPDTWVGDVDGNQVDVRADCQWVIDSNPIGSRVGGYSWLNFVWNKTTPLDYDLSFSNGSAALTMTTKMRSLSLGRVISTMTLSFEGTRNDTAEKAGGGSFHDLNPIQLESKGNASVPEFRFLNGSQIYFATGRQGWTAAATPLPQTTASSSGSRSGRTSSNTVATTTSSSRNAAPTRGLGRNGGVVVTAVVVRVVVEVLGLI